MQESGFARFDPLDHEDSPPRAHDARVIENPSFCGLTASFCARALDTSGEIYHPRRPSVILRESAGHIGRDLPPEATQRHSARERWAHRARSTTRGDPASFCARALEGQAPACPQCAAINPRRASGSLPLQLQMKADAENEATDQGSGLNRTHSFHSFHSWFPIPSTQTGANEPGIPDPPRTLPSPSNEEEAPGTSGGTPLLLYAVA